MEFDDDIHGYWIHHTKDPTLSEGVTNFMYALSALVLFYGLLTGVLFLCGLMKEKRWPLLVSQKFLSLFLSCTRKKRAVQITSLFHQDLTPTIFRDPVCTVDTRSKMQLQIQIHLRNLEEISEIYTIYMQIITINVQNSEIRASDKSTVKVKKIEWPLKRRTPYMYKLTQNYADSASLFRTS